jgi:hypothetical protein
MHFVAIKMAACHRPLNASGAPEESLKREKNLTHLQPILLFEDSRQLLSSR